MFPIPNIALWLGIAAALVVGGYVKGCTDEREVRIELEARIEAQTQAALDRIATRKAASAAILANIEESHATALRNRDRTIARLRADARPRGLPAPPAGAGRPDLACYPRAELDRLLRADQEAEDRTVGLLEDAGGRAAALDAARAWWKAIKALPDALPVRR